MGEKQCPEMGFQVMSECSYISCRLYTNRECLCKSCFGTRIDIPRVTSMGIILPSYLQKTLVTNSSSENKDPQFGDRKMLSKAPT